MRDGFHQWLRRDWLLSGVVLRPPLRQQISICTDASKLGWGAHLLPSFESHAVRWIPSEARRHSNEREMMAAFRAIVFWKDRLSGMEVLLLTDNTTVVAYINNEGGTRVRFLCDLAIQLLTVCQIADIRLRVRHIPGRLNVIADGLSRDRTFPTEWTLAQAVFQRLLARFPTMQLDLFATRFTTRLPMFISPFPDDLACGVDGLSVDWTGKDLYALAEFPCCMTLVASLRWNHAWITTLLQRITELPR